MKSLYSTTVCAQWVARAKRCLLLCALSLFVGFLICLYLCTRVTTGNASTLLVWTIGIFTLAGWISLWTLWFSYAPARAQVSHMNGMLEGDMQEHQGTMHVLGEKMYIPKSIAIYKVALKDGDETKTFHVNAHFVSQLPKNGTLVKVQTVRKFITAYEVIK